MLLLLPISLIPLIYEDFKYRAIHWFWLVLFLFIVLLTNSFDINNVVLNFMFIMLKLTGVTLYFSIKNRRFVNIINQYLGIGDILFFIPLLFLFSPFNFLAFFILSLTASIIGFGIINDQDQIC